MDTLVQGGFSGARTCQTVSLRKEPDLETVIRRPDAPNHFMVLKPINRRVVVRLPNGDMLAESTNATRLMESGKTLYDPVIYLPKGDVTVELTPQDGETKCPLKGNASYFTYGEGEARIDKLAWSYPQPLDFARDIEGLVAFYSDKVIVEEHPL